MLCVCYWPLVREIFPNYEVVVFQPWALTTTDLGSVYYCYIANIEPPLPLLPPPDVLPGGAALSCPDTPSTDIRLVSAQDHHRLYISWFLFITVTCLSHSLLSVVTPSAIHGLQGDLPKSFIAPIILASAVTLRVMFTCSSGREV